MDGKWITHGEKNIYTSEWLNLDLVDVELPDGNKIEHHVVRRPNNDGGVSVIAHDLSKGVLMIWRHRFTTDTWGWELPSGGIDQDEKAEAAAARELLEETGWTSNSFTSLFAYDQMSGLTSMVNEVFYTKTATWKGPGRDKNEAADIAWLPLDQIKSLIKKGDVRDSDTLVSLFWAIQFGPLAK